jgi:hypothetical protein
MRVSYAIVFVSDMDHSVAFYRDFVGLALRFASPQWSEFATGNATLALHRAKERSGGQQLPLDSIGSAARAASQDGEKRARAELLQR